MLPQTRNSIVGDYEMPVALRTVKRTQKPANPQGDPRFQKAKEQVVQKANQLKKHPPAKQKASEAAKAAKGPPNEKAAGAKSNQVDTLKDTKAQTPPPDSFLAVLRAEIDKKYSLNQLMLTREPCQHYITTAWPSPLLNRG